METADNPRMTAKVVGITLAAILIQLALGAVYGWSVFVKPLMDAHHWTRPNVTLAFSLAICFLGISAFLTSSRVDRSPQRVAAVGGLLYGLGTLLAGVAVHYSSLMLLYIGYGVIGGLGMGMSYLVPIAVAIKWVPHRRGLISGVVVMGFGAGAVLVGTLAPGMILAVGPDRLLLGMGAIFAVVCCLMGRMMTNPPGYIPKAGAADVNLWAILKRGDFWALWGMLFFNVAAGIALISQASPMAQEMHKMTEKTAGTLVATIAIFNGLGRVFWSSLSDKMGRRLVFLLMYASQIVAFILIPQVSAAWLFVVICCYILLCYGGGFGTMPAFTADIFGNDRVGRIYGPILTAWSAAGLAGPVFYAFLREQTKSYVSPLYLTAGVLAVACALPVMIRKKA